MSRGLSVDEVNALSGINVRMEHLFHGVFGETDIRLWTGVGPLTHDSVVWDGNGWLERPASISEEISANASSDVTIRLTAIPQQLLSAILLGNSTTTQGKFYLAFFNDADELLSVRHVFSGELDDISHIEGPQYAYFDISYVSQVQKLNRPRELRWSDAAQQARFPGDKGFEYMPFLQQSRIFWGREDPIRIARR